MYKRGYSPGGEDCTGTYVEAVSICAHLSVNHLPNAPSERTVHLVVALAHAVGQSPTPPVTQPVAQR
eukprot:3703110-Pyramimonas_sp.AAC.1